MSTSFPNVPWIGDPEVQANRIKSLQKGQTRRQAKDEEVKQHTYVDAKAFKAAVRKRDGKTCRACGRKVEYVLERVGSRGEVHHIHGRTGLLRFESRAALQACGACHDQLTGELGGAKLLILPIATFALAMKGGPREFTDATGKVIFVRIIDGKEVKRWQG